MTSHRTFHLNAAQVNLFLIGLILLDVALSTLALFFPGFWFHNFHDLPYVDPAGLLRRTGMVWVAFTLLQGLALWRWRRESWWLVLIAGVRFTELFSDWMTIYIAQQMTLRGTIELAISPPANLLFGLVLIATYRRLESGPLPSGSVFSKPWS